MALSRVARSLLSFDKKYISKDVQLNDSGSNFDLYYMIYGFLNKISEVFMTLGKVARSLESCICKKIFKIYFRKY